MTNITLFIKHVQCSFQAVSKVKSTELDKIVYELKMLQKNVHKHVVVHRQKVVKKKTGNDFFLYCVIGVYIFCHLKNRDSEPQKWVLCDTFFTDKLLDAKKERTFMKVAKTKIPELLRKYNSVHIYA